VADSIDNAVIPPDQQIATILREAGQGILARLRPDARPGEAGVSSSKVDPGQVLLALAQAFACGRWGSFYCLFSEPMEAVRYLGQVAMLLTPYLLRQPDPDKLVSRLLEIVREMALVVGEAERASAEREAKELRLISKLKTDWVSLTMHELRRPVGLIRGHLELLQDGTYGSIPSEAQSPLGQIAAGAHEIAHLLDGLAAVAKLRSRAGLLQRAPCRVSALVSDVVQSVEREAGLKRVQILKRTPRPDLQVMADAERMRIALLNLLTNAIKYAPPDTTVTVQAAERPWEVAIAIADQGPGIDPSEANRIFEMHYRSQRLPDHLPGLGLGLYIVREIVELHGGRVTLQSAPGQGSVFAILLPCT
jgi:signal transduction histidine kinase